MKLPPCGKSLASKPEQILGLAHLGKQLTPMQLSQFAEYQADSLGFQFILAAKYDPTVFPDVLAKLNRFSSQRNSLLSDVFRTHPPTNKRIEAIQKLLNSLSVSAKN
jgi:predicted Zn-dependent protease